MRRLRWAAALTLVTAACALIAGCTGGAGADPRQLLAAGAEQLAPGGSAHVRETLSLELGTGPNVDTVAEGTVSWEGAGGSTGELTVPSIVGQQSSRAVFTSDAVYTEVSALGPLAAQGPPALAGKKWIRQTYDGLAQKIGPIGVVLKAAVDNTNPVRSAALLVQSPDLHQVGEEQIGGVSATHYTGQIRFTDAVENERLGLSKQVLDELRREISAAGLSEVQQYDLWVDGQNRPLRAEGRSVGTAKPERYSIEYSDYAGPKPVQAPPAGEVVDLDQVLSGIGSLPR